MPRLSYRDPDGRAAVLPLADGEVVIGRDKSCAIVLNRRLVSRKHCRLFQEGGRWILEDLDSSHGTRVNGSPVKRKTLEPEDRILVGDEELVVDEASGPPRALASPEGLPKSTEILAAQPIDQGELVRTLVGARRMDVTALGVAQPSVTQLGLAKADRRDLTPADSTPRADSLQMDAHLAAQLLAVLRLSDELRHCAGVTSVCETAVTMAMKLTGASRAVLALRDNREAMASGEPLPETSEPGFQRVVERLLDGAAAPASIRISGTFVDKVVREKVALLARDTGVDRDLSGAESVMAADIRSLLCTPLWDGEEILGYLYLDTVGGSHRFRREDFDLVSAIGHLAASEVTRLTLAARIHVEETRHKSLARFFSSDVIRHIEQLGREGKLDPTVSTVEQEVTVLFADIKGFTSMSERLSPAQVKEFLVGYLGRMTEILVDRHGGTLDKYIGDAIMALFGAPFSHGVKNDAERAVAAAVEMRDASIQMRSIPLFKDLSIHIGINTGKVIAGTLGSDRRLEYTVIGDAVNVASRLESSGEPGRIHIGEGTWTHVKDVFECESAGTKSLRNRAEPVNCYWVTKLK